MRYLGIDYGSKRVGVALSDESGVMAFPNQVLKNDQGLILKIKKICDDEKVGEIVVGESLDYKGKPNPIMKKIDGFVAELKEMVKLPVMLEPEFMTSQEAVLIQGETEMHDASAAALILKSFLDKKANN